MRQTPLTQPVTRSASREKLNIVLANIGGYIDTASESQTRPLVDVEKELRVYDWKVHKAYGEMVKATYMDLGKLGIPVFCIKEDMVVKGGEEAVERGKLGEGELGMLRGRMMEFLEDELQEEVSGLVRGCGQMALDGWGELRIVMVIYEVGAYR